MLADAFEKFRNSSYKNYGLCPSHYLSAVAFSWDAMLNMKEVEFELISDTDIIQKKVWKAKFFYISKRYSKISNKYL